MRTILVAGLLLFTGVAARAADPGTVAAALAGQYGLSADEAARLAATAVALAPEAGRLDSVSLARLLGDCRRTEVAPDQLPRMLAAWGRFRERLLAAGDAPVQVRHELQMVTRSALSGGADRGGVADRLERAIGARLRHPGREAGVRAADKQKEKDKEKYKSEGGYGGGRGKKPKPGR